MRFHWDPGTVTWEQTRRTQPCPTREEMGPVRGRGVGAWKEEGLPLAPPSGAGDSWPHTAGGCHQTRGPAPWVLVRGCRGPAHITRWCLAQVKASRNKTSDSCSGSNTPPPTTQREKPTATPSSLWREDRASQQSSRHTLLPTPGLQPGCPAAAGTRAAHRQG